MPHPDTKAFAGTRTNANWGAVICHKSRSIHIGYYDYQADVEITYDNMAVKLLDAFVCLNFQYRPEIEEWLL